MTLRKIPGSAGILACLLSAGASRQGWAALPGAFQGGFSLFQGAATGMKDSSEKSRSDDLMLEDSVIARKTILDLRTSILDSSWRHSCDSNLRIWLWFPYHQMKLDKLRVLQCWRLLSRERLMTTSQRQLDVNSKSGSWTASVALSAL